MVRELTADKLLKVLAKDWLKIVLITVLFAAAAFLYSSYLVDFEYTSEGTMIVTNNNYDKKEISKTELDASARLVDTYKILLSSTKFCAKVARDINLGYDASAIKKMLALSAVDDTEVLSVKATTLDPELSRKVAQSVLDNAQEEIKSISEVYFVKIIDNASVPINHSYPNISFNTLLGIVVGVIISFVFVLLNAMLNTQIKNEQELTERYTIPTLGAIPNLNGGKKK